MFCALEKVGLDEASVFVPRDLVQLQAASCRLIEHSNIDDAVRVRHPDVVVEEDVMNIRIRRVDPQRFPGEVAVTVSLPVVEVVHEPANALDPAQESVYVEVSFEYHVGLIADGR